MTGLSGELRSAIYETFAAVPYLERNLSHWVMNQEWVNECRKLELEAGPAFWHFDRVGEYMLGIPIEVRAEGGLPHLERA